MITDLTQSVLTSALGASATRHRAIANNVANVETPGYHRLEVDFESQMRDALNNTAPNSATQRHEAAKVRATTREDNASPEREQGNNVDPEREMSELAGNTIQYQAVLQALEIKGSMVRAAIYEGRR